MTIINNNGLNTSASLLMQQFAKRAAQPANIPTTAPASTQPEKSDPYAALTSFLDKMKDIQQAIMQASAATQRIDQSRKAVAAEMVRRIKEQLRMMMSMMAGMDPKTKARLIAQMSRELAAAVREYAAASGGAQEGVATTAGDADAQNDNTASSGGEQNAMAGAAGASETSTVTAPEASAASQTPGTSPDEATGAPRQVGGLVRDQLAEYSQHAGSPDAKADQEFATEVRKLAAMLKALAKQNEVHARKDMERSTERETANTLDALGEVERSLSGIVSADIPVAASISVVAK